MRRNTSPNLSNKLVLKSASLSPVQQKTLDFLKSYIIEHNCAPSLKEIALFLQVKSLSTVHFHLERLSAKGFIKRNSNGLMTISNPQYKLYDKSQEKSSLSLAISLIGEIAAGAPLEAYEEHTLIAIPSILLTSNVTPEELFALKVRGDSMIEKQICDGDTAIIRKQNYANNGDIIVALFPDNTATLKTYQKLPNDKIALVPANKSYQTVEVSEITIQGKLVGLLRTIN
jgi:repressor LexA